MSLILRPYKFLNAGSDLPSAVISSGRVFMDFFDILRQIMLPSKDNGLYFTDTQRLEKINDLLLHTGYKRLNTEGPFVLYSLKPLDEIRSPIVISSHVDCVMTRFFTRENDEETMIGTYDNCLTNSAVLTLMLEGSLHDDIVVAFTGDEECNSNGAIRLCDYFRKNNIEPLATIVLDVTDAGWDEADFTVENNFWCDALGRKIINEASRLDAPWKFIPSDPDDVPTYVPPHNVIFEEAEADESWEYDEQNVACFSLCIPVKGDMHSNQGVLVRKRSCLKYVYALNTIANRLTE